MAEFFFGTHLSLYTTLFIGITILAIVSRGTEALEWSQGLMISGAVNMVMQLLQTVGNIAIFLLLIPIMGIYNALGLPQIPKSFWEGMPFPLMCLLLLFAYDFCLYWLHRALHMEWLWPVHAVHHSDEHLHFMSWSRSHPLEIVFIGIALTLGLTWMGLSVYDVAALAFLRAVHQHYVHAQINWDHGKLGLLIASPQFHRWHHVDEAEAIDKNFASIFPILDKAFGTYYNPGPCLDKPTGFKDTPGNDLTALILYPFYTWHEKYKARKNTGISTEPTATINS